jgi:hypothetical protein
MTPAGKATGKGYPGRMSVAGTRGYPGAKAWAEDLI